MSADQAAPSAPGQQIMDVLLAVARLEGKVDSMQSNLSAMLERERERGQDHEGRLRALESHRDTSAEVTDHEARLRVVEARPDLEERVVAVETAAGSTRFTPVQVVAGVLLLITAVGTCWPILQAMWSGRGR